jgi:hypothetical protein
MREDFVMKQYLHVQVYDLLILCGNNYPVNHLMTIENHEIHWNLKDEKFVQLFDQLYVINYEIFSMILDSDYS